MSNPEKILKSLSSLIENGILTSKDIKREISTDLKFKKDKIISKLELVSREEFEVLKKIVQKQEKIIKSLTKRKTKRARNLNCKPLYLL
jgi:BMFP domain-containing protein YqiC